jgi:hypothetical protein
LVIFATFIGFQGGLKEGLGNAFAGAIIITLGMFFPCFLFTIAGHTLLETLVQNKVCSRTVLKFHTPCCSNHSDASSSSSHLSLTVFVAR